MKFGGQQAFVAVILTTPDGQPIANVGQEVTEIRPLPARKVVAKDDYVTIEITRPVIYATYWPQVATFWAIGGGAHTRVSLNSGVCPHPVEANSYHSADEDRADWVVTLMSTLPHWWNGRGMVWHVDDIDAYGFAPHPTNPWILVSEQTIGLPTVDGVMVSHLDLPVRPVDSRPDPTMLQAGALALPDSGEFAGLPLRGPHPWAFHEEYACRDGGQLYYAADGSTSVVGDQFVSPEDRHIAPSPALVSLAIAAAK